VAAGFARPLYRPLQIAANVHGESGLDGPALPKPSSSALAAHAVDFLAEKIMASAHPVTLVPVGPLTNIAMLLNSYPDISDQVDRIVLMGGAIGTGNVTPAAEFNIYVDPEAADVVMQSGVPIVMAPLDLTHRILATRPRLDAIKAIGNRAGPAVAGLLSFSERFDLAKYGSVGAPLHDPCVIAYLLRPDLFTGKTVNVSIETSSSLTLGMTVTDWWQITDRPRNVNYLRDGNADGFFALLTERLARLP
jgi:purine nucleosidase